MRCRVESECEDPIYQITDEPEINKDKPKLLLHSCCGPCSTAVVEALSKTYDITIYFYNPNITDTEEYRIRRDTQLEFVNKYNEKVDTMEKVYFLEGEYNPDDFLEVAKGLEDEPEGGMRCGECFKLRLEKTAQACMLYGYKFFTTTLSISPHKNYEQLKRIGCNIAMRSDLVFLTDDFSTSYQRSIELSKAYGLYRQKFCGCEFAR